MWSNGHSLERRLQETSSREKFYIFKKLEHFKDALENRGKIFVVVLTLSLLKSPWKVIWIRRVWRTIPQSVARFVTFTKIVKIRKMTYLEKSFQKVAIIFEELSIFFSKVSLIWLQNLIINFSSSTFVKISFNRIVKSLIT